MNKIVIKIGTNVLSRPDGLLDITAMSHLTDQIVALKNQGKDIIIITSGAVGAGRAIMHQPADTGKVVQRQVLAAVGQPRLMKTYSDLFERYGLFCAQVLATKEDFRDRQHYLNMRNCFEALLQDNIIPLVNENDVIAVSELMFTDNDELAGLVASMIGADGLIILSSVDGILNGPPGHPDSKVIPLIEVDDKKAASLITPEKSSFGRGGMMTKYRFACQAAKVGINTFIANGKKQQVLLRIAAGAEEGTRFVSRHPLNNLKKWMAYQQSDYKGKITINAGAAQALMAQVSSLLPVGVTQVEGDFTVGDLLQIVDQQANTIGVGQARYSAETARQYMGQKGKKPLIHYDYLYII